MLNKTLAQNLLQMAIDGGADFAELFVEKTGRNQIMMVNGELEKAVSGIDSGIGIRLLKGGQCLYNISNNLDEGSLIALMNDAVSALEGQASAKALKLHNQKALSSHPVVLKPLSVSKSDKAARLRLASNSAFAYDSRISQARLSLGEQETNILIANSDGQMIETERIYSRFSVEAVASSEHEKQTGHFAPGARRGYEFFRDLPVEDIARDAARMAVTMLDADLCPSGTMPVVIDNGFGGVIFHEACGHGLEATALARNASVFEGKLGQQVASHLVTAIDDATLPNEWGSLDIDDEGEIGRRNVLIENGILKGYLVDRHNGSKLGLSATGSARRQSYRYAPTSRMSNTFIDAGTTSPKAIIRQTPYGLYAKHMGGGSVDTASGEFNFSVLEGYLIKDGQIDRPVRGATLIGKGSEVLMKIDQVGSNLALAQGMCGSISGQIQANVGQPMIRVSDLLVGGRAAR